MDLKSYSAKNKILDYIVKHAVKFHPAQEKLMQVTMKHTSAAMMGAPEQLQFLAQMAQNIGAKKTLDIGVFTGYSALAIALVLPSDGKVVACDVSEDFTSIGKPYWKEAGVDNKIDLRIAPATETLQRLVDNGEAGTFDFAFIDADKPSYEKYYELALELLRPGGFIAIDNMLWGGKVADPSITDEYTTVLRDLGQKLAKDSRINYSLLNLGDGTSIAFKL